MRREAVQLLSRLICKALDFGRVSAFCSAEVTGAVSPLSWPPHSGPGGDSRGGANCPPKATLRLQPTIDVPGLPDGINMLSVLYRDPISEGRDAPIYH